MNNKLPVRLFVESDILKDDEFRTAKRRLALIFDDAGIEYDKKNVFNEVKASAWNELAETWEAVLRADEIYASSSLTPLLGYGSYTGAPVIFDKMCELAIHHNITGKSVYILRAFGDIDWDEIDLDLLKKAFKSNHLYTLSDDNDFVFEKVNIIKHFK